MTTFRARLRGLFGKREIPDLGPWVQDVRPRPGSSESFTEGNNDFALAMYERLRQQPGNLFFSPFSIRTALAMTHAGADGDTAAQMSAALHFSTSDDARHIRFAEILQRLNAPRDAKYDMTVANSLWGQDGAPLHPGFLDLITRHYGGTMNVVDFRRAAEAARLTINQWVDAKTRRRIRELIPPRGLDAETRLVLVNAIYFKSLWLIPFREGDTRDETFHLEGGGRVRAPLMRYRVEVDIPYLEVAGYQAVDLAYQGGDVSMLVLLPRRRDGLQDLERTISARMLRDCAGRTSASRVKLFLPRFKVSWEADLVSQLTELGMPLAFTRTQADFSGINGKKPPDAEALFISSVHHKAFAEINEEGTEATAATAIHMMPLASSLPSLPPRVHVFRADHPFLFAIRDRKSGTILFLGRIADPTREISRMS